MIIKGSRWNNNMNKMSWRVDINALSKQNQELNEPIAYIELETSNIVRDTKQRIEFDMTQSQVYEILQIFDEIQKTFDEAT